MSSDLCAWFGIHTHHDGVCIHCGHEETLEDRELMQLAAEAAHRMKENTATEQEIIEAGVNFILDTRLGG